ncbi:hypothetical protein JCM3774_005531 [Rhodotorula dairenensis]
MVLVDGVKYACQQCIKGHRSSKCTHSTRPLTEIRRKGRPSTQCAHCKQLRKTRSVHARCDCAAKESTQEHAARVLPNGLADVVGKDVPDPYVRTEPSGVTRLLNPCNCLRGGKCTCCESVKRATTKFFPDDPPPPPTTSVPVASTSSAPTTVTQTGGCCSSSGSSNLRAVEVSPALPGSSTRLGGDIVVGDGGPAAPYASTWPSSSFSVSPYTTSPSLAAATTPTLSPPLVFPASQPPLNNDTAATLARATTPTTSFPLAASSSSNLLFLPPTAGTLACFCGPTCQCVGCATHDPYSRKRPAPGACSGGGCHCGTKKGCEAAEGRIKKSRRNDAGPNGCCGTSPSDDIDLQAHGRDEATAAVFASCCDAMRRRSGSPAVVFAGPAPSSSEEALPLSRLLSAPLPPDSAGIALPSLWSSLLTPAAGLDSAAADLSAGESTESRSGTSTPGGATAAPLPSLRTLWPALLDLGNDGGDGGGGGGRHASVRAGAAGPGAQEVASDDEEEEGTPGRNDAKLGGGRGGGGDGGDEYRDDWDRSYAYLELPEGLLDPALEPAILRRPPSPPTTAADPKLVLTACSACFLEEPLDDACGDEDDDDDDEGCQCTSRCGCRKGRDDGGGGGGGSTEEEKEEGPSR